MDAPEKVVNFSHWTNPVPRRTEPSRTSGIFGISYRAEDAVPRVRVRVTVRVRLSLWGPARGLRARNPSGAVYVWVCVHL